MNRSFNRRSAITIGLAAASVAAIKPAASQTTDYKEKLVTKGVVRRDYGSERSMIPGFKTVALRDIVVEPGAMSVENNVMPNAMVCHILEGELEIVQDG